ncbi:protein of unknown function [Blastococcus saxobsidens DD2]|uniref:Uncharacterized protein n=1 Tax=Blastococcus saxobsidens (strain DD2) TaxID=1146883 RepID=H6RQ34_BLASD|nr:protein of unknown function [Blastococcus saxobsidens DD2]
MHAHVRMEPVGPRIGSDKGVTHRFARGDDGLRQVGHAVHVVPEPKSVPVHGGRLGQPVVDVHVEQVSGGTAQGPPWHLVAIRPRANDASTQVDFDRRRGHRRTDATAGASGEAGLLNTAHRIGAGQHPSLRCGGRRGQGRPCATGRRHSGQPHRPEKQSAPRDRGAGHLPPSLSSVVSMWSQTAAGGRPDGVPP